MNWNPFLLGYAECALWSESDDDGKSLVGRGPMTDELVKRMSEDCARFQSENAADLEGLSDKELGQAGHDFWLTRNRHGAGFWDGDWPEEISKRLTSASHRFGEMTLYVGDDGRIHAL